MFTITVIMKEDFTYIDDIIEGVIRVIDNPAETNVDWNGNNPDPGSSFAPWKVYNIGSNNPVTLNDYISEMKRILVKKQTLICFHFSLEM